METQDIRKQYPNYKEDILSAFAKHSILVSDNYYVEEGQGGYETIKSLPNFSETVRAVHIFEIPISDVKHRFALRTLPNLEPISMNNFHAYSERVKIIYYRIVGQKTAKDGSKQFVQQIMALIKSDD